MSLPPDWKPDPDYLVKRHYDTIRVGYADAGLKPWEDLTEEEREKVRVGYRRYRSKMDAIADSIRNWKPGGKLDL